MSSTENKVVVHHDPLLGLLILHEECRARVLLSSPAPTPCIRNHAVFMQGRQGLDLTNTAAAF